MGLVEANGAFSCGAVGVPLWGSWNLVVGQLEPCCGAVATLLRGSWGLVGQSRSCGAWGKVGVSFFWSCCGAIGPCGAVKILWAVWGSWGGRVVEHVEPVGTRHLWSQPHAESVGIRGGLGVACCRPSGHLSALLCRIIMWVWTGAWAAHCAPRRRAERRRVQSGAACRAGSRGEDDGYAGEL